ncbi:Inositol monophosphatase-like - like 2 [Theobroma cacao]|uniref:histidinol-phosphatase n=2 Tax=Theobroma cacao TaxID=3641 RepID=A0AB32VHP3_THECC|nr:PREDICTED: bifunctional phosphatase IMPL2, chloroplastic [Theobroma cacao]EOX97934.1 Bifunctional phosphatase IMPL2, chloroplastic isoform 1 [Theobroma cacao]WRX15231.1 Inositol monophosphatase-like - like 2 [Theobroma cacao]
MLLQSQSHFLSTSPKAHPFSHSSSSSSLLTRKSYFLSFPSFKTPRICLQTKAMISNSKLSNHTESLSLNDAQLDRFAEVGNYLADAAGEVIRKYFRKKFEILDKEDLSPVTIADQAAEESMVSIILENFPSHAIYGEENGWRCKENSADYVWVLDPIDGTKSFITGKPVFGTLIALLHKSRPILGIIDQPVLRERWIGISGRKSTLNGQEVATRTCTELSRAYLYTTSPHLFSGDAEEAFARVKDKVKLPLYGCDCYAYALLASGYVDLVIESGLRPYDFLALVPVIEGAGGVITDWKGQQLDWKASSGSRATSFNVVAAGDKQIHRQALDVLQWR